MGDLIDANTVSSKALKIISFFISIMLILFIGCDYHNKTIEEKNKSLIISFFEEGINNQNYEIFNKLLSPDFVRHSQSIPPDPEKIEGIENYKNFIENISKRLISGGILVIGDNEEIDQNENFEKIDNEILSVYKKK